MSINSLLRWFLTLLIIVIACVFCYIRYNAYFRNPWTCAKWCTCFFR